MKPLEAAKAHARDASDNLFKLLEQVKTWPTVPGPVGVEIVHAQAACAQAWATIAIAEAQA